MAPTLLLLHAAVAAASSSAVAGGGVLPPWDYAPAYTDHCIRGSTPQHPNNSRLVFVALPEGPAPKQGWPIYFSFVTDSFPSKNGSIGGKPGTPNSCEPVTRDPGQQVPQQVMPFAAPQQLLAPCIAFLRNASNFTHDPSDCSGGVGCTCDYDQMSGEMWSQREKGALVASGVAVVQMNPWGGDAWDAGLAAPDFPGWGPGPDLPAFEKLFEALNAGSLGPLDSERMIFRGWSGGAQMVSWFAQLHATGELSKLGGAGAKMIGGVYISGGSYACYPNNASTGFGVCASCNSSSHCEGAGFNQQAGCSTCTEDCGGVHRNGPPCCAKCCPTGYAEQYYHDNPTEWKTHPPAFLAQGSTMDGNADLCAAKNYHDTLVQHGVSAELVLQPEEYESCGCIGQPSDEAAVGSPYAQYCVDKPEGVEFCHSHVMSFARMVVPLVAWVRRVLAPGAFAG